MNTLVIFSGLPGTGKSMLANKLARELGWPLLRIDDILGEVPENPGIEFWNSKVAILLAVTEVQLELGLSIIVDSVFMNTDRQHAQNLARTYNTRFRPIYTFVSDDRIWEQRVYERRKQSDNKGIATWDDIQYQRGHFREWESDTALFIDSLYPFMYNYAEVLRFATSEEVAIKPLEDIPLIQGNYHG